MRLVIGASAAALAVISLIATADAQGQATVPSPRFGVAFGVGSATLIGHDVTTAHHRMSSAGGLQFILPFSQSFSIQPELVLTVKGDTSIDRFRLTMRYVELPVLIRFEHGTPLNGLRTFAYGGASFAVLLDCYAGRNAPGQTCNDLQRHRETLTPTNTYGVFTREPDPGTPVNRVDHGLIWGAGLAMDMSPRATFTIGARVTSGLTRVTDEADSRNYMTSIMAGFEFPLGK